MLAVIGTVPDQGFPLIHGKTELANGQLIIRDRKVPVYRGTPALLAAAVKASEAIGGPDIYAFLIGDTGRGDGSRDLYRFITGHISEFSFQVVTFHYLLPILFWHNRVLSAVEQMNPKPVLVADAGFMYAAKMSGQALRYDLFTPDIGELAFLADEMAPHPFYTRGFILHQEDKIPDLIERAYRNRNASRCLLVKGESDFIVSEKEIIQTVDRPSVEAMEAIGGTGDSLTGLVTVLCAADLTPAKAAILASKANRWMGCFADSSPATRIADLIDKIPHALRHVLNEYKMEKIDGETEKTID